MASGQDHGQAAITTCQLGFSRETEAIGHMNVDTDTDTNANVDTDTNVDIDANVENRYRDGDINRGRHR